MIKKLASVTLAISLVFNASIPALASTVNPKTIETGRTEMNVQTGIIMPERALINSRTLIGTVLIDGPQLVMSVKSNNQLVQGATINTFRISDKLFGYSILVPADGSFTLEARTVYANGKHAGQTHTNATSVKVTADTTAPVITLNNYMKDPTNQSITVTASTNEGTLNATSYTFDENGSFEFVATDAAGNVTKQTVSITNIDKVAPTGTVNYSTTSLVNTNVVATLDTSEPVTITNNNGSNTYTFTQNGSFTFEFKDAAGNIGTAVATVTNIDKTSPVGSVVYSTTQPTNQDVTVTINFSKPNVTVLNNNGSRTHTFTENGSFTFEYKDLAGNTGSTEVTVNNIDKEVPTAEFDYSTTNPTNKDVTVILLPSENVTVLNNEGLTTYTFTKNGDFTFEFEDAAGNKNTATAKVSNIDKEVPTASVIYSLDLNKPTNQDIVATITPSEVVKMVNNNESTSYTFEENGSFTFEFVDAAGNEGSVTATVSNIDKIVPTATVVYSHDLSIPTNQDVVATITASEDVVVTSLGGSFSHTFTENGKFTFAFVDAAGNEGSFEAEVNNIDKDAPTAEVKYSTTSLVNKDVVVTLVNESESITVTNNGGSTSYTFTENGEFTFEFVDVAGNTGSAKAIVSNIDKTSPVGSLTYSTIEPTNQNVTVTIKFSKPSVTVTNNDGSTSYTFEQNGDFTFEYIDAAGNTGTTEVSVNNIDKVAPTATVSYSTLAPTKENVIVSITPSETVTVINNEGLSRVFTDNGTFTFQFRDAAGNIGTALATVSNIDRTAPTATVAYSTTAPTNQDVVVTINPSEAVTVTNNNGSLTRTFTANGSYTFEFKDAAGNTGSVTATVNNIDKVAPVVSGVANGQTYSTAVAPTFNEGTATLNGLAFTSGTTITNNGNYTLMVTDVAGNETTVSFIVNTVAIAKEVTFASFTLEAQGPNQFKVFATYTVSYTNGTSKTYTNVELAGGNIANPKTQNNNSSTKDYTFEGLVYTVTAVYDAKTDTISVTATKK